MKNCYCTGHRPKTKIRLSAIMLMLLFAILPLAAVSANAQTFDLHKPSFGLYCENQNADIHGKIRYVIDENANAVQFSQYTVNATDHLTLYIPFISNAYTFPEIDLTVNDKTVTGEICYGEKYTPDGELRFYSSDIDESITGTLYTLKPADNRLTVDFKTCDRQNFIYLLPYNRFPQSGNGTFSYTLENPQPDGAYEIYALNGEFESFDSNADIIKQRLTLKEYIDRNYNELGDFYGNCGNLDAQFFYALANKMLDTNTNSDYFNFFLDSVATQRVNAYKIEMPTDTDTCTVAYSTPVYVQKNGAFNPAIYLAEQTATGNYNVDYTVELNVNFPYIIESSADVKKQGDYAYTVENITDDFYFIFSSAQKPKSIYNNGNNTLKIVLIVIISIVVCALTALCIFVILHYKKVKRR